MGRWKRMMVGLCMLGVSSRVEREEWGVVGIYELGAVVALGYLISMYIIISNSVLELIDPNYVSASTNSI